MRLIDADAVLDNYSIPFPVYDYEERQVIEIPLIPPGYVRGAPTIDAVPVVHAKWLGGRGGYKCSACAGEGPDDCYWPSPYCPNCGAKMEGEAE